MGITLKSALKYLEDFDSYSPYQEALGKVCAYIEKSQKAEKKMKKIRQILDTDLIPCPTHLYKSVKLDAISNVIRGKKQEYKFWKFLDEEVEDGNVD